MLMFGVGLGVWYGVVAGIEFGRCGLVLSLLASSGLPSQLASRNCGTSLACPTVFRANMHAPDIDFLALGPQ